MSKKNILILQRRPGIGDMCLFFSCINEICKFHRNCEFTLLTNLRSKPNAIFKNYDKIKEIKDYKNFRGIIGFFKLIFFFKKKNFERVYIFHYGFRYFIAAKLASVKKIHFYGFYKKKEDIVKKSRVFTKVSLNNKNLKFTNKINFSNLKNLKKQNKIIIGIGGSGNDKKWSIDNFIQLAEKIYRKKKVKFIIAGGKGELKEYAKIKKKLSNLNLISMCELPISKTFKYICGAKFYIGNDTGFMHIAALLGVKSFGLFGNTPTNYSSYNKLIIPITPKNHKNISHNSNAMDEISVSQAYQKIKNYI